MEQNALKDYSGEEAKHVAEALLKTVIDYQSEEQHLQMKWNNPASKKPISLKNMYKVDPNPILFNLNEVEESKDHLESSVEKQSYKNPFTRVDPFS